MGRGCQLERRRRRRRSFFCSTAGASANFFRQAACRFPESVRALRWFASLSRRRHRRHGCCTRSGAGLNNERMSIELAFAMAFVWRRTLVSHGLQLQSLWIIRTAAVSDHGFVWRRTLVAYSFNPY